MLTFTEATLPDRLLRALRDTADRGGVESPWALATVPWGPGDTPSNGIETNSLAVGVRGVWGNAVLDDEVGVTGSPKLDAGIRFSGNSMVPGADCRFNIRFVNERFNSMDSDQEMAKYNPTDKVLIKYISFMEMCLESAYPRPNNYPFSRSRYLR